MRHLFARAAAVLDRFILRVHGPELVHGILRCSTCDRVYPCPSAAAAIVRLEATKHLRDGE